MSIARMMQQASAGVSAGGGDAWTDPDLANASYDSVSFNIASSSIGDVYFKPDGTNFFDANVNGTIKKYSMTTPWDLASVSYTGSSLSAQGAFGIYFKTDGTSKLNLNYSFF